jgi:hypothetical protein
MDAMNTDRVACINTEGYTVSLVLNAIYETLPDDVAAKHKLVRVVDESGEDYLYPESYFVPAEVFEKAPDREFHPRA